MTSFDTSINGASIFHCLEEKEVRFLQSLGIFHGLFSHEVSHFLQKSNTKIVPAGAILFLQGDAVSDVYIILDGLIKLSRTTENGEESVVSILTRGDVYIETTTVSGGPYPVSGFALTQSRVLKVPASRFFKMALSDSRMARNVLTIITERVGGLIDRVEELSLKSSCQRLASYLVSLCNNDDGTEIVCLPLCKCVIAQQLGMKPETLSRSFAKLRAVGVSVHGEKVSIRDVGRLREYGRFSSSLKSSMYAASC